MIDGGMQRKPAIFALSRACIARVLEVRIRLPPAERVCKLSVPLALSGSHHAVATWRRSSPTPRYRGRLPVVKQDLSQLQTTNPTRFDLCRRTARKDCFIAFREKRQFLVAEEQRAAECPPPSRRLGSHPRNDRSRQAIKLGIPRPPPMAEVLHER